MKLHTFCFSKKYPSKVDPGLMGASPAPSTDSGTEPNFGGQSPKAKMTLSEIRSFALWPETPIVILYKA